MLAGCCAWYVNYYNMMYTDLSRRLRLITPDLAGRSLVLLVYGFGSTVTNADGRWFYGVHEHALSCLERAYGV